MTRPYITFIGHTLLLLHITTSKIRNIRQKLWDYFLRTDVYKQLNCVKLGLTNYDDEVPCTIIDIMFTVAMIVTTMQYENWTHELTLYWHIKTAEQRTVIQQYSDWYAGR